MTTTALSLATIRDAVLADLHTAQILDGRRMPALRANGAVPEPVAGRVSVVTVCYNAAATIAGTLDAVAAQTYPDLEYIVIDGASTDGTQDLLRARAGDIDLLVSAPDSGIAEAFNKGLALASGDYIAILNADDLWPPEHLGRSVQVLMARPEAAFSLGDLVRYDDTTGHHFVMTGDPDCMAKMLVWPPEFNHPTMVCRRSLYETVGGFDHHYRVVMDYEWMLRAARAGAQAAYSDSILTVMRMGGNCDRFARRSYGEIRDAMIDYGRAPLPAYAAWAWRRAKLEAKSLLAGVAGPEAAERLRGGFNPYVAASTDNPRVAQVLATVGLAP